MQSYYGQVQRSTYNGNQVQTKENKKFNSYGKSNKELNALIEKKSKIWKKQEKEENREGFTTLPRNTVLRW